MRQFVLAVALVLVCLAARAQDIYQRYNGTCAQGGQVVKTNGNESSNKVIQSYPSCTVTVFNHGTITLSSIFFDAAGTIPLANPFTATSTGVASWYAADGRYDVQYTNGGLISPVTVSDITLCFNCTGGGGGGGNPGGVNTNLQVKAGPSTFGAITNVSPGSALVSNGVGSLPVFQTKPKRNIVDYGTIGGADDSLAMQSVLASIGSNQSVLQIPGQVTLESFNIPTNVTLEMANGALIKPISTSTPPGGAGFVQGSGGVNTNPFTSSCSVTLNGVTGGNGIVFLEQHAFLGAFLSNPPSDGVSNFSAVLQQGFNFSSVVSSWVASNVSAGNHTITITYPGSPVPNHCIAWEISGMGIVMGLDSGLAGVESNVGSLTMTAGASITATTGALVIGYGGQTYKNQVCTAGGGTTLPAGTAGSLQGPAQSGTGYGDSFCASYKLSSGGGAETPSITITDDPLNIPLNKYWAFSAIAVIPKSAVVNIRGPINTPAMQIFTNALAGQGTIDFTGNTSIDKVFPEWWGAAPSATAATNTPAIQAAIVGAYGSGRVNGTQQQVYNRELHFSGTYNLNGTLNVNHMNGFHWTCSQRFACGLNQTAVNTSIMTTTSGGTYGAFDDFDWSTTAAQDISHPLVDLNYTASPGNDLVTQFIDFNRNTWQGSGIANTGLRIAAAGGGAQGSNIYFYDNAALGFTEAAYMIGNAQAHVCNTLATNALAITWYGGDIQGSHHDGIENCGAGFIKIDGTSFENGFGTVGGTAAQTGFDIWTRGGAAGDVTQIDNVRSESSYFINGNSDIRINNSGNADQAQYPTPASSPAVGLIMEDCAVSGNGKWYKVTVSNTFAGLGTCSVPRSALSGSGTTIQDSIGGLTVNAWTGFQVGIVGGTGKSQYCIVTSNTADTFTCSGGWQTYFVNITIANPDATSTFVVGPQWGTTFSQTSGLAWVEDTTTIGGGGGNVDAFGWFVPGLKLSLGSRNHLIDVQVTRDDWMGSSDYGDNTFVLNRWGVIAGVNSGSGSIKVNNNGPFRAYKTTRNGIVEVAYPFQNYLGTATNHYVGSGIAGGTSAADVYTGADLNLGAGNKSGRYFVNNNSSGSQKLFYFNANGSQELPGALIWTTDNANDIGAAGANRPRLVYAGTDFVGSIGATTPAGGTFTSVTTNGSNGGISATEGTGAGVPAGASLDVMWPDSTAHRWKMNNNNEGTSENVAGTLPSGNVTTAGTVVNTGTCQAQTGITITGSLTTDNVVANIGAALPATWQTGIVLSAHVTANGTVTVYLCNPTAGSITPAATQVNVRIVR